MDNSWLATFLGVIASIREINAWLRASFALAISPDLVSMS